MSGLPDIDVTVQPGGGINVSVEQPGGRTIVVEQPSGHTETIEQPGGHVVVVEQTGQVEVTISVPGVQGPPGPPGPAGDGSGGSFHTHVQTTAAKVWTIVHGLGRRPGVAVEGPDGTEIDAGVYWPDTTTVIVTLGPATAGRAHLS